VKLCGKNRIRLDMSANATVAVNMKQKSWGLSHFFGLIRLVHEHFLAEIFGGSEIWKS
jgi:hypothetical protein